MCGGRAVCFQPRSSWALAIFLLAGGAAWLVHASRGRHPFHATLREFSEDKQWLHANQKLQKPRTRLQTSRWQLHDGIHYLESKLNVPRRIRNELVEHPMRWSLAGVVVGLVAVAVPPLVLAGRGQTSGECDADPAWRAATMFALPFLMSRLKSMAIECTVNGHRKVGLGRRLTR